MKSLMLALFVLLGVVSTAVDAEPRNLSCLHSIGPPGNWCPKCSQYPNYLWARRVEPVEGPCLRCYLGCSIATASPAGDDALSSEGDSAGICPAKPELTLSELEQDSLVSLQVDEAVLREMARRVPIAASMIAVLHAQGDPLPVLERLNEFQIQFRDRPVAQSAIDYFSGVSPAAKEELPDDSDVLTTAKSSHLDRETVLLEIQSELRSARGTNLVIEGPVMVELRGVGKRAEFRYGDVTVHPKVMSVGMVSGVGDRSLTVGGACGCG